MKEKIFIYILILNCISIFTDTSKTLKISITNYPPYEMVIDNEPTGLAVEIMKEVFRIMNQSITIREIPWSRALLLLETGEIDCAPEVLITQERLEYIEFSKETLLLEATSLFVLDESDITFDGDLKKLKDYTFGVRKDFSYGDIFDTSVKNKILTNIVEQIYDDKRLFQLLSNKKIDIYVGDKYGTFYQYKLSGQVQKIKRLSPDLQSTPTYMAFSKKNNLGDIRDRFDVILAEIKENGVYAEIIKGWEDNLF